MSTTPHSAEATATSKVVKTAKAVVSVAGKTPAKKTIVAAKKSAETTIATAPKTSNTNTALAEKAVKPKKPKMVRDSFSFPKAEYAVLQELKERSNRLTRPAKKTELLRAAIKTLADLDDTAFLKAIQSVPSLKTGRPSKVKAE